jgi:hypothetical protein
MHLKTVSRACAMCTLTIAAVLAFSDFLFNRFSEVQMNEHGLEESASIRK